MPIKISGNPSKLNFAQVKLPLQPAPGAILCGQAQDERSHLSRRGRSARCPFGGAIVFPGDEPPMPVQERARGDDAGDLLEPMRTDVFGLGGQPSALVVVEPGLLVQLLPHDLNLLLEVFDHVLLMAVDPAGQTNEEELKMVHPGRIEV